MKFLAVLCIFFSLSLSAQNIYDYDKSLPVLSSDSTVVAHSPDWILYIHSSLGCGYCHLLRRHMAEQEIPDNLRIVFLEYHTPEAKIIDADSTYLGYEVRRVTLDSKNAKVKLFPTSQLVRVKDSRVVKKYRGYQHDFWEDLFKRVYGK